MWPHSFHRSGQNMVKKSSLQNESESKAGICPVWCNCREQKDDWQYKYQGMNVLFLFFLRSSQWESSNSPRSKYSCDRKKNPFPAVFLIMRVSSQWLQFSPFLRWLLSQADALGWQEAAVDLFLPILSPPSTDTQGKRGQFLIWLEKMTAHGSE